MRQSLREPRALLAARVEVPNLERCVLSTHFGLGADQRADQARALLAHLGGAPDRARWIVMGDFNGEPDSPEIELLSAQLNDVMQGGSFDQRWTIPTGPDVEAGRRLASDDVIVRDLLPVGAARVERSEGGASDHFPLLVDLMISTQSV